MTIFSVLLAVSTLWWILFPCGTILREMREEARSIWPAVSRLSVVLRTWDPKCSSLTVSQSPKAIRLVYKMYFRSYKRVINVDRKQNHPGTVQGMEYPQSGAKIWVNDGGRGINFFVWRLQKTSEDTFMFLELCKFPFYNCTETGKDE